MMLSAAFFQDANLVIPSHLNVTIIQMLYHNITLYFNVIYNTVYMSPECHHLWFQQMVVENAIMLHYLHNVSVN